MYMKWLVVVYVLLHTTSRTRHFKGLSNTQCRHCAWFSNVIKQGLPVTATSILAQYKVAKTCLGGSEKSLKVLK